MIDHCQELVAKADKDRYLSCLYAPASARPHLFALYAFNIEITRIRDSVSEPQIGLVRQQWWLDTIDGIYASATQDHPVAQALARAIEKANLPKQPLKNLIIARERDLYDDPFLSLNELEGYLGETSSALIQMACLMLGSSAPEAAGLAGVALGIAKMLPDKRLPQEVDLVPAARRIGLLHSLPLVGRAGVGVGQSLLKKMKPTERPPPLILPHKGEGDNEALLSVVGIKAHARKRLAEARAIEIPSAALPAFLPASLAELYLKQKQPSQFRRQLRLWIAARQERF
jgi:15-cis-phytoene synthase